MLYVVLVAELVKLCSILWHSVKSDCLGPSQQVEPDFELVGYGCGAGAVEEFAYDES